MSVFLLLLKFWFLFYYSNQSYEVSGHVHVVPNDPLNTLLTIFLLFSLFVKKAQETTSPEWMSPSRAAMC